MSTFWRRFLADESGATMVEYGLIVATIAVAAMVGVNTFGISVRDMLYNYIIAQIP